MKTELENFIKAVKNKQKFASSYNRQLIDIVLTLAPNIRDSSDKILVKPLPENCWKIIFYTVDIFGSEASDKHDFELIALENELLAVLENALKTFNAK